MRLLRIKSRCTGNLSLRRRRAAMASAASCLAISAALSGLLPPLSLHASLKSKDHCFPDSPWVHLQPVSRHSRLTQCSLIGQDNASKGQMACRLEDAKFHTQCGCLGRNMECGPDCGCAGSGQCLNRAVQERRPLQLGKDLHEVNAWGIDCYTRRNIRDGKFTSMASSDLKLVPGVFFC